MNRGGYSPTGLQLPQDVIKRYCALKAGEDMEFVLPNSMAHLPNLDVAMALEAADPSARLPSISKHGKTYLVIKNVPEH